MHDNLQNPSDALLILAHAAGEPADQGEPANSHVLHSVGNKRPKNKEQLGLLRRRRSSAANNHAISTAERDFISYPPVLNGMLDRGLLLELLQL